MHKQIIPYINAENEMASSVVTQAQRYANEGADGLYIFNFTGDDRSRTEFNHLLRQIEKEVDIQVMAGCYAERFEDVKKTLYTGASRVVLREAQFPEEQEMKQIISRFPDKIWLEMDFTRGVPKIDKIDLYEHKGIAGFVFKHVNVTPAYKELFTHIHVPVVIRDSLCRNDLVELITQEQVSGVSTNYFETKDIHKAKLSLHNQGIDVDVFESSMDFSEFKLNADGLIPAIAQDYRTGQVLMLGYMNEESFLHTLKTGKMTYYSRSRQELWCKGDTSGHYQYVKSLAIDCDKDTILAKVKQIGAACHTGNYSCFYTELAKKDFISSNPLQVLNEDYQLIAERKLHPKEGSYTNYLFEQGIDKILKKCGEEATEICIAAKNPDAEELKYEIADYLYHLMVLMAECNLDWDDVARELVNRRTS